MASGIVRPPKKIQSGTTSGVVTASGGYKDVAFTFDEAFTEVPVIVVGFYSSSTVGTFGRCCVSVAANSTTGFTARIFNGDTASRSPALQWIAVGN
ncbi:MAG: hypothetical protein IJ091_11320 [Oscillospiraceae bacterium]|nr:hypothetical protein [Oscillospiraceae bacterium]MBQ8996389.1 hypothetical protein [Oscillospiraceae bacterium]